MLGCSNQKNTFVSRQYHSLTTHYNVYFNGNESLKKGQLKIEEGIEENYSLLLPVFQYQNSSARASSASDMDRAIEKATKAIKIHSITRKPKRKKSNQSEKYKEFRKKKEFNNWIDDCYLLLGKAQFYKKEYKMSEETFEFIVREYPDSKLVSEAKLWLARSLIDRGEYIAGEEILDRLDTESELSSKLVNEIYALRTDLLVRQQEFEAAISELERTIALTKNKRRKARYYYLLVQLHQRTGNALAASQASKKLVDLNSTYEITFNAKISQALSYTGDENGEAIRKELKKMLRDQKNLEYQDQIYFALAEMDMKDDDMKAAIANYWESTKVSVYNDNQKAISFLKLGDYYFGGRDYPGAQMCYDSSMTYLGKDYPNYSKISVKVGNLTELVNNLNMVEREDSLQMVATMSSSERENLISELIKKISDREQEQKLKEAETIADRTFFGQNNMLGNNRGGFNKNQGNWYFYNPTNIGLGKSEFQRKWGRRKLEDNWRRKNRSSFNMEELEVALEGEDASEQVSSSSKGDPKSRAYYMVDLPMTKEAMAKSNKKIMRGLFQASMVYGEKLDNKEKALETLAELLRRFPENPYLLQTYYHCYSLNKLLGNTNLADQYKSKILSEFKDSNYAKALTDPNYYEKIETEDKKANRLYEQAYEDFQNYYYNRVISQCNEGLLSYQESELRPRFLFLRALCIGRTQDVNQFKQSLQQVLEADITPEVAETTKAILAGIEGGKVPTQYDELSMEQARQNRLLRNWRIEEEQALVEVEEKKPEKEALPEEPYQITPAEEHCFVLMFDRDEGDPNRTLFNVTRYNSDSYSRRTFKVDRLSLNEKQVMVIVKNLKDKEDALNYFNGIITNERAFSGLEEADYRNFIISESNFSVLQKNKAVEQYLNFYTKNYFNVERETGKTIVKKKGKLVAVNSNLGSTSFEVDDSTNHKFVLLVPAKKVNINKLRTDIYNHDKDFSVLKEQYDTDLNMIVVNNIGTKSEAMNYFKKLVEDKSVYAQLENIDYRNFIASEENFEKFYVNKNLSSYLSFFRANYLAENQSQPVNDKVEKELVTDGLYTFNADVPHYFAMVYPTEDVNRKQLQNGIKRYNTRSLKLQVRQLDENREILLVANMRNKKQAMMYFRAIVTNRDLFAPVEKVGYRNFVISSQNLEVFMDDGDPAVYLQFFKKHYLK